MAKGAARVTSLDSAAVSAQVVADNRGRSGLILHNTDANACHIKYGATATTAIGGFTEVIGPGDTWYMPDPIYTGRIDAIWSVDGAGGLSITEY